MENGVRVVEGNPVEEWDGVDENVLELRTEEHAVDGSYGSKESEGDEQFEEALEEGALTIDSDEATINGNAEELGHSGTGVEVEKFDEGGDTPVVLLNDETSPHDARRQLDGLVDISNQEDEAKSTGTAESEMNGLVDADETINVVGHVFEQAENGVIDHENLVNYNSVDEAVVHHVAKEGHETQGTLDVSNGKGSDIGLHSGLESNGLIGSHDELKVEVVNETGGNKDNELADKHAGLPDTLTKSSCHLDIEDQGENIATLTAEMKENELPSQPGRIQEAVEEEKMTVPLGNATDTAEVDGSVVDNLAEDSNRSDFSDASFAGSEPSGDEKEITDKDNEHGQTVLHGGLVSVEESSNGSSSHDQNASSEVFKFVVYEHANRDAELNQSIPQNTDEQDVSHATGTFSSNVTSVVPTQLDEPPRYSVGSREPEHLQGNRETTTDLSSSLSVQSTTTVPAPSPSAGNRETTSDMSSSSVQSAATVPAPSRPAGLGRAALLLEPVPRAVQQQPRVNGTVSPVQDQLVEDPTNGDGEETDETREKLQMIRVKFLRLAHRLGQTPHNVVVAQVLYRLGLAEQLRGRNGGRVAAFSFDRASAMAEQLEAAGQEPLDFSCTIMVLGKSGVGKSATINSIFDEIKFNTDAFELGTKKVQDVVGMVQGIKVRVIDTPGLLPSWSDQRKNEKILRSIKQYIKNTPPDIVLYLDRLDMPSRELGDMPLLRTITEIFGPSVWFNAIVVLTHAASAPPEGPNGTTTSYDMFVSQRSQVVQQAIRQAAGDMRLMNPVSLVENHSACRTNRAGQRVLPNGQVWKPHLLLLSFASKILAEANTLLKLQDSPPGKVLASRARSPPLPFLLSSLLQSRPPVKLPTEQFGDDDALDDDLNDSSDSDDESEYDELPPFKRLTKAQLADLSKEQRKAYFKELEYREKLFMKKQLNEEKQRRKVMKKMQNAMQDLPSDQQENAEEESGGAGTIPVPMPDLALPASFDSDNPTHRYRYLDSSQWLVRPVLDTHGWDHDVGYEGINLERLFVVKDNIPVSLSGQISKDKKDTNLQLEMASTLKHSEGKATSLGFDLQSVGKDMAYTIRSETRFSNWKRNKAVAGLAATILGDVLTGGLKIEDKLVVNKQAQLVMSAGAMLGRADVAYGGSLEATLRDKDHPLGRFLTTLGVSVMDWRGDLAIGYNCQSQIPIGRATNLIGRVNVNNRGSGQVSIRVNSSEILQIAFIGLLPLIRKMFSDSQQGQFG